MSASFASIQAYLRKSASRDRLTEQIGPFLATISPDNENPYLNYAIPEDNATPTSSDVEALIAAYQRHQRTPRLEYIAELAPQVEPALIAHGFTVERTTPLMVYAAASAQPAQPPAGIELITPQSDQDILDHLAALGEVYGDPNVPPSDPPPSAVDHWRRFIAADGIMVSACEIATGKTVGAGVCDVPFDSTTELAGVGVCSAFRRRGIAAAMTSWLANRALAAGTRTIFLMAAGEDEARIYRRVGFSLIGQVLHISQPQ